MNAIGTNSLRTMAAIVALSVMTFGCSKDTTPTGPADESAPSVTITFPTNGANVSGSTIVRAEANDNVGVTKVEFYVDGSLKSTVTSPAWEFMWNTRQTSDGKHTIFAKAYDKAGNSSASTVLSVTVKNPYEHTFYNSLFTPVDLAVNGSSYVIPASESVTVQFATNPGTFHYQAQTSGRTTQGTQVGMLIQWDYDVSTSSSQSTELILSSDHFFLKINNKGYSTGGPVYVNYGLLHETVDNISVPSSGLYNIGYYRAYSNTNVRMYLNGSDYYSYWDQGYHFTLPFTQNQSVTLVNTNKAERKDESPSLTSTRRGEDALTGVPVRSSAVPAGCNKHVGAVVE